MTLELNLLSDLSILCVPFVVVPYYLNLFVSYIYVLSNSCICSCHFLMCDLLWKALLNLIPLSTVLSLYRAASGGVFLMSWGYFAASSSLFFLKCGATICCHYRSWNMSSLLFFSVFIIFFKRATTYRCKQKTARPLGNDLKAHGGWRLIQARAVGDSCESWLILSGHLKAKAESSLYTPICLHSYAVILCENFLPLSCVESSVIAVPCNNY